MNIAKLSVNPVIAATPSRSRSRAGSDVQRTRRSFPRRTRHATNSGDCDERR